jgi:hypothetical protein
MEHAKHAHDLGARCFAQGLDEEHLPLDAAHVHLVLLRCVSRR